MMTTLLDWAASQPRKRSTAGKLTQEAVVYDALAQAPGRWLTLPELEHECRERGKPSAQTSISARLRELPRRYTCTVSRRLRSPGLWEYALGVQRA